MRFFSRACLSVLVLQVLAFSSLEAALTTETQRTAAVQSPAGATSPSSLDLGPVRPDPKRLWTIAVYLGGDNDLDPFALRDLKEMERGLPEEGVECVVLLDRAAGPATEGDDRSDRVLRIRREKGKSGKSEVLAKPGEVNMADPALLQSFLSSVIKTFPARHYALILWDHGGGWAAHLIDSDAPGASGGHDRLTLPKLRRGIAAGLKDAGLPKLDIVGFDMCLMAQLETAVEISELADIMVASEAVEPGDGWPYESVLPFFGNENVGARRLAGQIVEAFGRYYGDRGERIATLSALDLGEIGKLLDPLDSLSSKVLDVIPGNWPGISRALFYTESYADRTDIRKGKGVLASVDLLDMLKRLRYSMDRFPAEKEYQDLVAGMDRAVIAAHASAKHRLSHGLAIYAPTTGRQYNRDYEQTRLTSLSSWPTLLTSLHEAQEKNLSTPKISDIRVVDVQSGQPVKGGKPGGGFRIEATVEGENILWVQCLQAVRDEKNKGSLILEKGYVLDPDYHKKKLDAVADVVDLIMPEFKGNRNKVTREFVGKHLVVTNGERVSRATIDSSNLSDLEHVAVPVMINRAGVPRHFATVFFNSVTWQAVNIVGELPQADGSVAYRQIKPQPDDEITPLFEFLPDGEEPTYLEGENMKWKEGLELLINLDSPGQVTVAMRAESIGGRSALAETSIVVEDYTAEEKGYVENARKVKLKDLVGTWRWHGLKDGKWQPLPATTVIAPSKSNPEVLTAEIHNPEDPNWKVTRQAVVLDTRLMPSMRLISVDETGRPAEAMNFTMLVSRWDQGSPRMVLKYLVPKGWLVLWAKENPGAASSAPSGSAASQPPGTGTTQPAAPQKPPEPKQPPSLVGIWQSSSGEVLRIGPNTFELYQFNRLVDGGTYEVKGNQIVANSLATGTQARYSYQLKGKQLTLKDSRGGVYNYKRVQ